MTVYNYSTFLLLKNASLRNYKTSITMIYYRYGIFVVVKLLGNKRIGTVTAVINHKSCTNNGVKENDFDNALNSKKVSFMSKPFIYYINFS